ESPAIMSAMASGGRTGSRSSKPLRDANPDIASTRVPEAGRVAVAHVLPDPRASHDDQLGIARVQLIGADTELLEMAIAKALDQDIEVRGEVEDDAGRLRRFEVERDALLVPRVHFPVHADA